MNTFATNVLCRLKIKAIEAKKKKTKLVIHSTLLRGVCTSDNKKFKRSFRLPNEIININPEHGHIYVQPFSIFFLYIDKYFRVEISQTRSYLRVKFLCPIQVAGTYLMLKNGEDSNHSTISFYILSKISEEKPNK